jgi:hypothetical protein
MQSRSSFARNSTFDPRTSMHQLRKWAVEKINAGHEPPWAWYQYMKLRETIDAILEGMAATSKVNSQISDRHRERLDRPMVSKYRRGTALSRPAVTKVSLPM